VGYVGQVAGDVRARGEADEGEPVRVLHGEPQAGVGDADERRVRAQQRVHVVDHHGVPVGGHPLQRAAEGASRVAVLHGGPRPGAHEQCRESDGQQQHSEDHAEHPHLHSPFSGILRRPYRPK
jgi:hypothetical protein